NQTSDLLHKQTAYRENWIAGVSHDVRTPLSVILGRAGQLEDGDYSSEETRKQALYIKNQALKLRELINDLNLFSQLEKGTQPLREETFPPSVFFRQTIAAFLNNDPRTQFYQIETRIDPDIEKSTLHGDPGLLSRAINNLLYNSIQHTPAGTTLTLSLTYQSGFYRFSVSDNGKGVSPAFLQKLQTLAQGEIPDLLPGQEHGLGLSIVCQIVKLHKGKICFHNLQPHGFSTEILLPE
ncbi:MAG: sensor histidine kinase, partial [Butyricimonas faecihominis]